MQDHNARLDPRLAEMTRIILWCERRLEPSLRPYVNRMLASAIEARSGETENTGSTEGESVVGKAETPNPGLPTSQAEEF